MSTIPGNFIAGGVAACGAVVASHPFETVKIRMQVQGELQDIQHQPRIYKGPVQGLRVIFRNEGLRGIYSGLGPGAFYQLALNGSRLGFYEPIRQKITYAIFKSSSHQSMGVNILSGATSGVIGAVLGSPLFLVKTRLQTLSASTPIGTQYAYRGTFDGLRQIYRAEGFRGWYRGCTSAILRTGMGSSVQLPAYFSAKRNLTHFSNMKEGPLLHLASSTASGAAVCCVMHPADTVMARMYNQNGSLYRNVFDCLAKTIYTEGILACYKGFLPHLARILPHTILTLTLAEQTMSLMRGFEGRILSTFTATVPLE